MDLQLGQRRRIADYGQILNKNWSIFSHIMISICVATLQFLSTFAISLPLSRCLNHLAFLMKNKRLFTHSDAISTRLSK